MNFLERRRKSLFPYLSPSGERLELYADMLKQPHLLIAGATGSGKSVVIGAILFTALFRHPGDQPDGVQFILIDPKRVELVHFRGLPHCIYYACEPDTMREALFHAMKICENRYKIMQRQSVKKFPGGDVWIIIDEFADLMTTQKRVIVPIVQRLAQIGRAAKVHILLATQTPISKILPTEIKCNFDARVGLRTRSAQDSRNITGIKGCETLPRYGYGYYMTPNRASFERLPMIDDAEIAARIRWWTRQKSPLRRFQYHIKQNRLTKAN